MGLFSTKKQVFVSSVVYNLAGDIEDRVDFLKTTVVGGVLSPTTDSLGEAIISSYLNGPGITLRSYGRWGRTSGYNAQIGQTAGTLWLGNSIDHAQLAQLIPHGSNETVILQTAEIGNADYTYWADRYMSQNHPGVLDTDYTVDFNEELNLIAIQLQNGSIETFTPADFDPNAKYLYASYTIQKGQEIGPLVPGSPVSVPPSGSFPPTTDWQAVSSDVVVASETLTTTVTTTVTYSDDTPEEETVETSSVDEDYEVSEKVWEKTEYKGPTLTGDRVWSERSVMTQNSDMEVVITTTTTEEEEEIEDGVTKTTTVVTVTESLRPLRSYQIDKQEIILTSWSNVRILIYKQNSGNPGYDAMFVLPAQVGTFLPFIPIRLNNRMVSDSYFDDIYPMAKKAMKKSIGGNFDEIVQKVEDNEKIGDIDYAYAVFGVSLNTKEDASKRYIYEFFQEIMNGQDLSGSSYRIWRVQWLAAKASVTAWMEWKAAQEDPSSDLYGEPEPEKLPYPDPPSYMVQVTSAARQSIDYNMTIYWAGIDETIGSGLRKPDAKVGELWFEMLGTEEFEEEIYTVGEGVSYVAYQMDTIRLNWQVDRDTWRCVEVYGLNHRNMIYGGKSVDITAAEALADPEESGFIIPLHEGIYRRMPIKDATQMATACCYLVFNCYQVVKQKWYQTGIFKILLIVVAIAITIYFGGAGATSVGLLGANAVVGASLGFTGLAATIAGAVANAVAAMVLTQILTTASNAIFGEGVGSIVGAIASVVAIQAGTAMFNGGSMSAAFGDLMKAENLLKLTMATGNGVSEYMKAGAQNIALKTQEVMQDYAQQSEAISNQYEELIGYGRGLINPMMLTDSIEGPVIESPSTFFSRTLLTGSEVAGISMDMIRNHSSITLSTRLP